jgi:hypothetical protein
VYPRLDGNDSAAACLLLRTVKEGSGALFIPELCPYRLGTHYPPLLLILGAIIFLLLSKSLIIILFLCDFTSCHFKMKLSFTPSFNTVNLIRIFVSPEAFLNRVELCSSMKILGP